MGGPINVSSVICNCQILVILIGHDIFAKEIERDRTKISCCLTDQM